MRLTKIWQVLGTPYQLEESPPGFFTIWDTRLEAAALEWDNSEAERDDPPPPSPIKAVGLTPRQARAWIMEAMGWEDTGQELATTRA